MATSKEDLQDLVNKIDWEGGLWEYVLGYGGEMPEEIADAVAAFKSAAETLDAKFGALVQEHGVEAEDC